MSNIASMRWLHVHQHFVCSNSWSKDVSRMQLHLAMCLLMQYCNICTDGFAGFCFTCCKWGMSFCLCLLWILTLFYLYCSPKSRLHDPALYCMLHKVITGAKHMFLVDPMQSEDSDAKICCSRHSLMSSFSFLYFSSTCDLFVYLSLLLVCFYLFLKAFHDSYEKFYIRVCLSEKSWNNKVIKKYIFLKAGWNLCYFIFCTSQKSWRTTSVLMIYYLINN